MEFDFTKELGKELLDRGLVTDGKPLVSIITPYYNAGKYFEQTFNCVMNQTFPWFEWIIVNDGSTDVHSIKLLEEYVSRDGRIILLTQKNAGTSAARNLAVRKSKTDILVPLDADDLIAPVFLEEIYWALYRNPDAGWAYSDSVGFGAQRYLWKVPFSIERLKHENFLVCTAGIRKKEFVEAGGYDASEKYYYEDWLLWIKLLALNTYPVHLSGYLFWYRRRSDGVQKKVQNDNRLLKLSHEKLKEAANDIRNDLAAKEYPCGGKTGDYAPPKGSNWEKKIFATHTKIHVMMLLPWMEMGGADLFNLDICRKIDKSRFEISVVTTVQSQNSWRQRFEDHATDIFALPDFMETRDFPEFISYFIRSREVDVVFLSNSYYGYYLVPWLRKEFPKLVVVDYVHMEEWYWRNGGYARTSGVMGDFFYKTYVCNEHTRQVLIRDFGRAPESAETLYIGVDKDVYDPDVVESGLAYREFGISEGCPLILFPCRIHPQKRPFLMIEIAKRVREKIPRIAFVVVGDGPQFGELKACVEREKLTDTVYLAGRKNDMRPYYKDCVLTLICSLKEGLALTAYESLSMGKPVITSNVGGQAELIDESVGRVLPVLQDEEAELDCRNFSEKEIIQYVSAICDLLGDMDNYHQICVACRQRIEKGFSSQLMIRSLENIFEDMTENIRCDTVAEFQNLMEAHLKLADELVTLMGEVEAYEAMYKNAYAQDTKNELMRIANSKWGSRLIRLAFKFKLNKLFR